MSGLPARLGQRLPPAFLSGALTCLLSGLTGGPLPGAIAGSLLSTDALAVGDSGTGPMPARPAGDVQDVDRLTRGWLALRAMDCARCHGRDHDGWAATSLIAAVRDGSRQRFATFVLDGDIARGMPGYRSQSVVVANLDAIYAYLLARARGELAAGRPQSAPRPSSMP